MGRVVPHTTGYVVTETPIARALRRRHTAEGEHDDVVLAVLAGEWGFFVDGMKQESDRAEVARFFARCAECREPVGIPYYAVGEISHWRGAQETPGGGDARSVPDWSIPLGHWLTDGYWDFGWGKRDEISPRQHKALYRLEEHLRASTGAEVFYPQWTQTHANERFDRAQELAMKLTDEDRRAGKFSAGGGYSRKRFEEADDIVRRAQR